MVGNNWMVELGCLFMGRYNPDYHHRRSIRLRGYDYSRSGLYFVTICIQNRECLLGRVEDGVFLANEWGETIEKGLDDMILRYPGITVESWVVMPNHMHCIVEIIQSSERNGQPFTLGEWVRLFKYDITKQINRLRNSPGVRVWQRNYYENMIRNEPSHQIIQNYIKNNPTRWTTDQLHPNNPSKW